MFKNKKKLLALGVMLITAGALAACSSNQDGTTQSFEKTETQVSEQETAKEVKTEDMADTIVYGISTSPSGVFNPTLTDSIYDDAVCGLVYTSLLKLDEEQNLKPYLAKDYVVSEDQKTITFTLNDNLKWSDGEALTSNDVA